MKFNIPYLLPSYLRKNWHFTAITLATLGFLIFNLQKYYSIADDSYIIFRYLDNWLDGHGLVYNLDERVEGYTQFLWIVTLAPMLLVGFAPETASLILGIFALVCLLWAVFYTAKILADSSSAGWAALILAASSVHLVSWSVSGMETVLFATFLALANYLLSKKNRHTPISSFIYGLAYLTRPTGAMHTAIAFVAAIPKHWREKTVLYIIRTGILFLILPAVHLIFRLVYYGYPLPNTFYAKLGGNIPDMVPDGLIYFSRFLFSGGIVLVVPALLTLFLQKTRNWLVSAMLLQILFQFLYVIKIGGDYFPFHRFLVPVIPALSALAGVGIFFFLQNFRKLYLLPPVILIIATAQIVIAYRSGENVSFETIKTIRYERELIASWLKKKYPQKLLAVNVAGLIPYRTGWPTVDMLGLNDRHIGMRKMTYKQEDTLMVGHLKYDGEYVCNRKPDLVITSGGRLQRGRSAEEAILQAATNTFPGDREFLRFCQQNYRVEAEELEPEKYAVIYVQKESFTEPHKDKNPETGEEWFHRGITMMQSARLQEAVIAFETAARLAPNRAVIHSNLGFALLDIKQHERAIPHFKTALSIDNRHYDALFGLALAHTKQGDRKQAITLWQKYLSEAPNSIWKERARLQLNLLQ